MDILLSIIGSAVLAALLAAAYTAGVYAGKAAAHLDEDEYYRFISTEYKDCLLYTSPSPRDS